MAKLISLIVISLVLTSVFSFRCKNQNLSNSNIERKISWANNAVTATLLHYHLLNNFAQTHSVASIPILALLARAALYTEGQQFQKIARWLNFNNKEEILHSYSTLIRIWNNDPDLDLTFRAFVDKNKRLSPKFLYNFREICKSDAQYLNYDDVSDATNCINFWFKKQYDGVAGDVIDSQYLRNRGHGLIFGTYMQKMQNWDHPFNPKGLVAIDFHTTSHEIKCQVALRGNGFVKFVDIPELRVKVLMLATKGEQNTVMWLYPYKPEDLVNIFDHIRNPRALYEIISRLKATCLNLYVTVGQSNSVNIYSKSIPALNLSLYGLKRVYDDDDYEGTESFSILQQLHLIADNEVRSGPIDSPACPGNNYPLLKIDHLYAYLVFNDYNSLLYAGIFNGD